MHTLRTLATILILTACPVPAHAQASIALDMSAGWLRRDWDRCEDPTRMTSDRRRMEIATEASAALFWQVPTLAGPFSINPELDWVRKCDKPPRSFADEISSRSNQSRLIDASDYRYFTWRWNVSNTIDDRHTLDEKGRITSEGDDFAAKIGITILKKGSEDPREISYVWMRTVPEDSVIVHQKKVLFFKWEYHRIVTESGDDNVGRWVTEARDLYADYKRIYPDEEPGKIVRIYVMSDSDNTSSRVTGRFSDLTFTRERPAGLQASE